MPQDFLEHRFRLCAYCVYYVLIGLLLFFYFLHLKKYKHGLGEYILEQSLSVTLLFFFFPLLLFLESTRPSRINENNYMIEF